VSFDRRRFLAAGASTLLASSTTVRAETRGPEAVQAAVARFAKLSGTTSCLVVSEHPTAPWQVGHNPKTRVFVGSAIKTFILAQVLREVEAGRFSESDQVAIDDKVRSLNSPVFLNLTGTTTRRTVLEAMIAHSDNTATDVAMAMVGAPQVRALIKQAGLTETQIPDSTRRLFSYLAGAPEGTDLGWDGMKNLLAGKPAGKPRPALNDHTTMASTSEEFVRWYQQALRGAYFQKQTTLVEFKRIQAMADAIWAIVPPDIIGYGKGGSIDWNNFHCISVPGQMIVANVPITFCFTINWTGPDDSVIPATDAYRTGVRDVLREAANAVR
jgi:beta-lactamase class A